MFRSRSRDILPIGLDIGVSSVKLLQLEVVADGLRVCAAAREPMPADSPQDVSDRVAVAASLAYDMIRHGDFRGRKVVASLPREQVHMKNLRMPPMPLSDLDGAMAFEAKNLFPFDTDNATVRWLAAGEVRQGADAKQEMIVLAAKHGDIEHYVEQLNGAGMVIESLDYEPCAIYRTVDRFHRRREDEQDVHVLADIGLRRTTVVIGRGRDINFIKSIEVGGQHLRDAVARKLGIGPAEASALRRRLADNPDAGDRRDAVRQTVYDATRGILEDLARELSLCLRYHSVTFRGHRAAKVRLVGGEASDPQALQILASALPIPVEVNRTIQNVDYSSMRPNLRQGAMSDWAIAMGLSLKGTSRTFGSLDGRPRGTVVPENNENHDNDQGNATASPLKINPPETAPPVKPPAIAARSNLFSNLFAAFGAEVARA